MWKQPKSAQRTAATGSRSRQYAVLCLLGLALALPGCSDAEEPATKATADATADTAAETAGTDMTQAGSDAAASDDLAGNDADLDSDSGNDLDGAAAQSDGVELDLAAATDSLVGDSGTTDAAVTPDAKTCKPGQQQCAGPLLSTCSGKGDGWVNTPCFPGLACQEGSCNIVSSNLIVVVDSSGSMDEPVPAAGGGDKCPGAQLTWPGCDSGALFPTGCTRMGVSKFVLAEALKGLSPAKVRTAMFRFPQASKSVASPTCTSGYYDGKSEITGDNDTMMVTPLSSWYWNNLQETLCSPYPKTVAEDDFGGIAKWLDNLEVKGTDPELRADGGTPIGKTLFYVGEYLRNQVIVDGKTCTTDSDCGSVHYLCQDKVCVDPARSCRETVVVLFTDGGESNSPSDFFSPWVQAKRMAIGLGCQNNSDCVGGATCNAGRCLTVTQNTAYGCSNDGDPCDPLATNPCGNGVQCQSMPFVCTATGKPCQPSGTTPGQPLDCAAPGVCVADPRPLQSAIGTPFDANVLRSPNGKPFGVKLFVVDISGSTKLTDIKGSASLAIAGNGKLLGADAADPTNFLKVVDSAFDIKSAKICGQ
jgi:hypothetical protein